MWLFAFFFPLANRRYHVLGAWLALQLILTSKSYFRTVTGSLCCLLFKETNTTALYTGGGSVVQRKRRFPLLLLPREWIGGSFPYNLAATSQTWQQLQPHMPPSALEVWSIRCFFVCVLAWTEHSMFDPQWDGTAPYLLWVVPVHLFGYYPRRGSGFHYSGLWLHTTPPISGLQHVSGLLVDLLFWLGATAVM